MTVLTAALNVESVLPKFIECLRSQKDPNFDWLVADGNSSDGTQSLLDSAVDLRLRVLTANDFGIYDALNRGLRHIKTDYYLVVGADDVLEPDAILNFRRAAVSNGNPDFVAAAFRQGRRTYWPRRRLGWLFGMRGVASSHSVGLLIKRDLHSRFGMYSQKLPIAADQLFVKSALNGGATIARARFIAGRFGDAGTSAKDPLGVLTEVFRVQIRTEHFVLLQIFLFALRLLKYFVVRLIRPTDS